MRSPSKNLALSERLTNAINEIIAADGRGAIDGVEFDFRHEKFDQDQWSIVDFLDDVTYLPNEIEYGVLHNQHALWFPWFGQFDDKALRAKVAKLKPEKIETLLKEIVAGKEGPSPNETRIDRLVSFLTPAYLIESGDKLSICDIAEVNVAGDHLHEHDRLIKRVWVQITKADGTTTKINAPYDIIGSHNIINAEKNGADPFGSILFRIVRFLKLKEPSQLRKFKSGDSDISTASAIAYDLYQLIEPAWYDSNEKRKPSSEEVEEAEDTLSLVSEAALLGYLWAKIEFEANLKPLADLGKKRLNDSKKGGHASALKRRQDAEEGWIPVAKKMAQDLRERAPNLSQDKLADEMIAGWKGELKLLKGHARLKQLIGSMEKSGELPRMRRG